MKAGRSDSFLQPACSEYASQALSTEYGFLRQRVLCASRRLHNPTYSGADMRATLHRLSGELKIHLFSKYA